MKSYLGLIPQYERVHRKNNRISILRIMLSVCLVMAIFSMADMAMRSQKNYFIKTNGEYQSSYYTGAVFVYGFLLIIALITVFNIFNSMNASVAARTRQYGVMRSIGMGAGQLYKMIAAEAVTYAVLGCVTGCVLGLPLNMMMFRYLIAGKWGISWQLPAVSLLLIVVLCFGSAALAIRRPIKKIGKLSIVDTIKLQQ